ncbi:MAG: polyprenyl synthetase family protein [Alistipes sp.]|nr:polyprenyl synthetase family protein [Candidatus Minthomonas equi]
MKSLDDIFDAVRKGIDSRSLKAEPAGLYDPIDYIVSIGGKRIRPALCLLTYSLFKDELDDSVLTPALALEIFHAFTLLHDDIMDKADMRRGHETVHKKWNENTAILSGDVMSIKAYEWLCHAGEEKLPAVLNLFNRTAAQVCEGQQYDMDFEDIPAIPMKDYIMMIGLKTSALIACAARMGAILAGADRKSAQALYDYGWMLGIAFQITDDYLDVYGDSKVFGKNTGGDITNNKKSWLLVESLSRASELQREKIFKIMEMPASEAPEKIREMMAMYDELGIRRLAEMAIEEYYNRALYALKPLSLSEAGYAGLKEYAVRITYRKK